MNYGLKSQPLLPRTNRLLQTCLPRWRVWTIKHIQYVYAGDEEHLWTAGSNRCFKKKIDLCVSHVSKIRLDMFPNARHMGQQLYTAWKNVMKKSITTHLNKLLKRINDYFPKKQRDDNWISDPFGNDSITLPSNEESASGKIHSRR